MAARTPGCNIVFATARRAKKECRVPCITLHNALIVSHCSNPPCCKQFCLAEFKQAALKQAPPGQAQLFQKKRKKKKRHGKLRNKPQMRNALHVTLPLRDLLPAKPRSLEEVHFPCCCLFFCAVAAGLFLSFLKLPLVAKNGVEWQWVF